MGYGYWGAKHARVLGAVPNVETTIIDTSPERLTEARAVHPGARTAGSLDDALDHLDGVVVCTPPSRHAPVAQRALAAGCAALVEKPLATSSAQARDLIAAAERAGVPLMVGHTFEYNAAVLRLKEIIDSGVLGRILYIDTARLGLGRYQPDVDVVWDLAPHDISILTYLLGEAPRTVSAWTTSNLHGQHPDVAYLRLGFPRTATHAFVHVSWLDPCKVRRVTVVGDRKMVVYNDLSDNERLRIYDVGVDCDEAPGDSLHAMPVSYRTGDITSPYFAFSEPLGVQDAHFVECVRTGATPRTPGHSGLEVVEALEAADAAHRSARTVDIDRGTAVLRSPQPVHGIAS